MDQFLETWLGQCYHHIYGEDEVLPSAEQQLTLVGEYAFNLPEATASFDNIIHELAQLYPITQSPSYIVEELIEYLLVFTVSQDCEKRQEFVSFILHMDAESQEYLMQIIKEHMTRQSASSVEEEEVVEEAAEAPTDVSDIVPHLVAASSTCMTCQEHIHHIQRLTEDLQRQKDSHVKEITTLKQALASESNKVIDGEMSIVHRDKAIFDLQQQLQEHATKLMDVEKKAAMLHDYQQQVVELQDALDVLRPKADKHDSMEGTIVKLREKLEELSEIKVQLKRESTSHNETFGKLVELEQEVEGLRKLKPQVEAYREEVAEYHIALAEYKTRLQQKEDELYNLQTMKGQLEEHQHVRLNEHQSLVEELRSTTEQLRERERGEGIGEGMSELNPLLMQELMKLRTDNQALLQQLDHTSVEHLEQLTKDIMDQKCVNHSLQSKWTTTKDALAAALLDIDKLTLSLQKSHEANRVLQLRLDESCIMAKEDLYAQRVKFVQKLTFQKAQHKAGLALLLAGKKQVTLGYQQELKDTYNTLAQEQQAHLDTQSVLAETQSKLTNRDEEVASLLAKRQADHEDFQQQVKRLKVNQEEVEQQLQVDHSNQVKQLASQHQAALQQAQQRVMSVQADLDNEVNKRRKIERLKKMYESEVQRQKMQLQAVGCSQDHVSSSGDYEMASKELKAMQEQLDHAHQEVVQLKNQLSAVRSHGVVLEQEAALNTSNSHSPSAENKTVTISRGLNRPVRLLGGAKTTATSSAVTATSNGQMYSFLEQAELNDKRLEQLAREKREILSRSLEENKEKMELSQKLLVMDKENTQLKAELRKMTLEKDRIERKYMKVMGGEVVATGKENIRAGVRNL